LDSHLICFEKDALFTDYPTQRTVMSREHKIYYKGFMVEAFRFLGHFKGVKPHQYNKEILYNILLDTHDLIKVNGLICETLHPNNIIAKLFKYEESQEFKDFIARELNDSILTNNKDKYLGINLLLSK
jgi:hypothetical protein